MLHSTVVWVAKWAPERYRLPYLCFTAANFLAAWAGPAGHERLVEESHGTGLVIYGLNCVNGQGEPLDEWAGVVVLNGGTATMEANDVGL